MSSQRNKKISLFKKIILLALCLIIPFRGFSVEPQPDDGKYDFNARANDVVYAEKKIMIPNQILSLYQTDLYSKIQYLNLLNGKFKSSLNDLATVNNSLIAFDTQFKEILAGNDTFSEDLLFQLEKVRSKYVFQSLSLPRQVSAVQNVDSEILSLENMFDKYCENTSSVLDPQYFSLTPNNNYFDIPIEIKSLHLAPLEAFTDDPHTKAVGWLTFSLATLSALAVYCISAGVAISTMVSFEAINKFFSVVFKGPAAIIVIVAVVVACAAVSLYSKIQNTKREEEAKEKERKLYKKLKEASELYKSNSLLFHKDQFQQFAFDICKNRASWSFDILYEDLSNEAKQKIDRTKCQTKNLAQDENPEYKYVCTIKEENQVNKQSADLAVYFTNYKNQNVPQLIENVTQSAKLRLDNMDKIIAEVESSLVETVSREMLAEHKKEIQSAELLDEAVLYYNQKIKRDFHKKIVSDYMSFKTDCNTLESVISQDLQNLAFLKENIFREFKDERNQTDSFFASDLEQYINQYITTYKSNVENCFKHNLERNIHKALLTNAKSPTFSIASAAKLQTEPIAFDPNASQITYDYSDNETNFFFNMSIMNPENLKRVEHGIFSFGLIGGFSKRNNFGVDDLTKANVSALELGKIAWDLSNNTDLTNNTQVLNARLHSTETAQVNMLTNINDDFDKLLQEIDRLDVAFSNDPSLADYEKYKEINSQVRFLQSDVKYPRVALESLISKTKQFKEKYFFGDILYLNYLQKKQLATFVRTTDTVYNNTRADIINKCLVSKTCESSSVVLNNIILMDTYTPELLTEFKALFDAALSQSDSQRFENLFKKWLTVIKESELFKSQNKLYQSHLDFATYEIDVLSQKMLKKYSLSSDSGQLNLSLHQMFGY